MSELSFAKQFLSALDARPIKLSSDHIADARQYPEGAVFVLPRLPHPPHPQQPDPPSSTAAPPPPPSSSDAPTTSTTPATTSSSTSAILTVLLKPLKPTHPPLSLPSVSPQRTSIYDLKSQYATSSSVPAAKIKILYKKKPVGDSKTVAEVVGDDAGGVASAAAAGGEVEFGVMIMGGGAAPASSASGAVTPPADTPEAKAENQDVQMGGTHASKGAAPVVPAAQGPSGKEVVAQEAFWADLKGFVVQRIRDEDEGERLVGLFKAAWAKNR